jgi:hypothetical protein
MSQAPGVWPAHTGPSGLTGYTRPRSCSANPNRASTEQGLKRDVAGRVRAKRQRGHGPTDLPNEHARSSRQALDLSRVSGCAVRRKLRRQVLAGRLLITIAEGGVFHTTAENPNTECERRNPISRQRKDRKRGEETRERETADRATSGREQRDRQQPEHDDSSRHRVHSVSSARTALNEPGARARHS